METFLFLLIFKIWINQTPPNVNFIMFDESNIVIKQHYCSMDSSLYI